MGDILPDMTKNKEEKINTDKQGNPEKFMWKAGDLVSLSPEETRGLTDRQIVVKLHEKANLRREKYIINRKDKA